MLQNVQGNGAQPTANSTTQDGKNAGMEPADSLKYAVFLLDKKVRNLEKKKSKIEKYQREKKQGKELNEDQVQAISRLDETVYSLQAAREMKKQFEEVSDEVARHLKKQNRKSILAEKESRRLYMKDMFQIRGLLSAILNFPEFADELDSALQTEEQKTIIKPELIQIAKSMQFKPEEMITEDDNEIINRFFCLVEGKAKLIKPEVPGITYAMAKAAILSMKDVWKSKFEQRLQSMSQRPVISPMMHTIEEENTVADISPAQHQDVPLMVKQPAPEESQARTSTALEEQAQAAIRSLTFTNRNFPSQQMNTQYSYDLAYDQMDVMGQTDEMAHEANQASMHSPVAFVATGGYDSRPTTQIPSSTEDVGFFVPIAPQFQQQAMRYPGNFADTFAHIPQVQFAAALHRPPQQRHPGQYEQRPYRRERPQRGGFRPSGNQRGGYVPQNPNDLNSRRMVYGHRAPNSQGGHQNY